MLRIISGKYKGKRLKLVPSLDVRPVPHKLKESLFSIIQREVPGCVFLDGFAGTGSIGIEALSRGARVAYFVEEYYPAIKSIEENLARCGAEDDAQIVHKEFNRGVIWLAKEGVKFDIIFIDPPYILLPERDPLKVIFKRKVLKRGGQIILRYHFKAGFSTRFFQLKRQIKIGDDILAFYVDKT